MMGWLPLLSLSLRPSAIPTKIVYANAKQSPNERCIVNPLSLPYSAAKEERNIMGSRFTRARETAGDVIWGNRGSMPPPGLMFVICMVMVMRFRNDGNFAGAMPRLPDSVGGVLCNGTGLLSAPLEACKAAPHPRFQIQSDTL